MADTAVGIDIGGTGIKGALIDVGSGEKLSERYRIPTPAGARPADVANTLAELVAQIPGVRRRTPIGVAFPAVIDNGVTRTAANVDSSWIGLDADTLFTETLDRPVRLVNDADAAGYAESRFGAAIGVKGLAVMVTLGTGIGTALIYKGHLIPNSELGHLELDGYPSYEKAASNAAREREELSMPEWAARLQRYFGKLEDLLQPEIFVVGGGISKKSEKFLPLLSLRTPIVPAVHLNNAGILGAAARAAR